jgi:hypothetical protein
MNVICEKTQFGVTLAKRINPNVIGSIYTQKHVMVLDIRAKKCEKTGDLIAKGIKEKTLKKLQNFQIKYEQMPIDLTTMNARQSNELLRTICEQAGNVLLLSEQTMDVMNFCHDCHIPITAKELVLVYSNDIKENSVLVAIKNERVVAT